MLGPLEHKVPTQMRKANEVVVVSIERSAGRHKRRVNPIFPANCQAFTDLFGDRPAGLLCLADPNKKPLSSSVRKNTVTLVSEFAAFTK